jgi:hypothetical protein
MGESNVADAKMSYDYSTFDEVTQNRLLTEYSETLPTDVLEGPMTYRGDYVARLMDRILEADSTARLGQPHNGYSYDQQQLQRPVRIFTRITTQRIDLLEDQVLRGTREEQLEEVS